MPPIQRTVKYLPTVHPMPNALPQLVLLPQQPIAHSTPLHVTTLIAAAGSKSTPHAHCMPVRAWRIAATGNKAHSQAQCMSQPALVFLQQVLAKVHSSPMHATTLTGTLLLQQVAKAHPPNACNVYAACSMPRTAWNAAMGTKSTLPSPRHITTLNAATGSKSTPHALCMRQSGMLQREPKAQSSLMHDTACSAATGTTKNTLQHDACHNSYCCNILATAHPTQCMPQPGTNAATGTKHGLQPNACHGL